MDKIERILSKPLFAVAIGGQSLIEIKLTDETKRVIARQLTEVYTPVNEGLLLSEEQAIKAYEKENPADDHAIGCNNICEAQLYHVIQEVEKIENPYTNVSPWVIAHTAFNTAIQKVLELLRSEG